ncbi:hypothetical protein JDN40_08825 [Rhodomicrobium vannielii ATCC 17100]|uniref:hypothetical protein n=1 Tax=Rhodomicrobium vannielii TaxID=1069 RepID=UPI00191B8A67|nr:hypothetical protein [Rhodomicrobium vannielii]MBJ7534206.1 hypothetical protein [Rhodomicrobium vannielii ATCC 17100]
MDHVNRRAVLTGLAAAAATVASGAARADDWKAYHNPRFDFSFEYPGWFAAADTSENSDGSRFEAKDGAAILAYGSWNAMDENPLTIEQHEAFVRGNDDYSDLTYRFADAKTLVLSGLRGDTVYYEKYLLVRDNDLILNLQITYPAQYKPIYDPLIGRMAKSLRLNQ